MHITRLISGGTSIYRGPSSIDYADMTIDDVTDILSELYVDRNCVTLMDVILEGSVLQYLFTNYCFVIDFVYLSFPCALSSIASSPSPS